MKIKRATKQHPKTDELYLAAVDEAAEKLQELNNAQERYYDLATTKERARYWRRSLVPLAHELEAQEKLIAKVFDVSIHTVRGDVYACSLAWMGVA